MILKILLFLLIFATAYLLKEILDFVKAIRFYKEGDTYKISALRWILIGISISYILTIIITGFGI